MPGFLLHVGALILCAHGGQAEARTPTQRVLVAGRPLVTMADPHSVTNCRFNVSGSPVPCVTATWVSGATRVRSQGVPVLLQHSQAVCAPNGTPVSVIATQTRVRGV